MLQDIPTPIADNTPEQPRVVIETERLTLRRPTLADGPAIAALANDIRIAQMMRRLPFPYLVEHAQQFIAALAAQSAQGSSHGPAYGSVPGGDAAYLIEHLHVPVGVVGIDWRNATTPELGYWLGCDHWGRGFATEAARAAIDVAFEQASATEIVAVARVANPASRNILEKCGFQWTGVELHRFDSIGSSSPVDCFRLTRNVWSSLKNWSAATRVEG